MMTEYMKKFNSDPSVIAYKKFMYDESNEFNCSECPANTDGEYRGCGQQMCWVTAHRNHCQE